MNSYKQKIIYERSKIIPIKENLSSQMNDLSPKGEYSLKQNFFDPSKSSPPNEFMIKLHMRMNMYNKWWDIWSYIMPMRVDKWVLLDTSLEESLKRITSRNRNGETAVDKDYQTKLYIKHIEFYNQLKNENKPVVIIESNIMDTNFLEDSKKIDTIIKLIVDF